MDKQPKIAEPKPKPRRRWHQFSLRTLLIAVALLSIPMAYVGRRVQIVQERKAMLSRIRSVDGGICGASPMSGLRGLLGDKAIVVIGLPVKTGYDERLTIRDLFPEAQIVDLGPSAIDRKTYTPPGNGEADDPFR